jgi:hypothetical protein
MISSTPKPPYYAVIFTSIRTPGDAEHMEAQSLGKDKWYESFKVRICKVERDYAL